MGMFGGVEGAEDAALANAHTRGQQENIGYDTYAAIQAINQIKNPSIAQMSVHLQKLVQQGVLTPEAAQTFLQQNTAFNEMDPQARNALSEIVSSNGLDPQARAVLHQVEQQQAATERGNRAAIMQNAAARGMAGSGLEFANQLEAEQGNATNAANQGFQAAADANNRRLQAISGLSTMDAQKAAAQDAINQFNAANKQSVENMNVNARNQAQAQNLSEKQRIADTNVGIGNQQQLYNKGLYQQDFANQMAHQQALANADLGAAQTNLGEMNSKNQFFTGGNTGKLCDEDFKDHIKPVDPDKLLSDMQGYSFEYKDGSGGEEGPHVGVMAGDVQKAAPQAVVETDNGKMIDFNKMGPPLLAALSALYDKVKDLEGGESDG